MQDRLTDELCPGVDDLDAHGERARRAVADGSVLLAIRRRCAAALHSNRGRLTRFQNRVATVQLPEFSRARHRGTMSGRRCAAAGILVGIVLNIALASLSVSAGVGGWSRAVLAGRSLSRARAILGRLWRYVRGLAKRVGEDGDRSAVAGGACGGKEDVCVARL